jgi:ABC-2 type transport system ATP-binding protein
MSTTSTTMVTDAHPGSDRDVVIRTDGLVKDYATGSRLRGRGAFRALDGLDLEIHRGEVFGFLGPNGAGKSTTIRVLLDLLRPTAGRAEVLGVTPRQGGPGLRARIGYLPGELTMSGRSTAGELLAHLARVRGGRGADRIRPLAERLTLDLDKPIRGLSKGNKQKVGVVQAFMHRPELLILDEPTSGLDPLLQHEFLSLVREARGDGATVFMSSHVLSEVELVAGRVAIVRQGRIVDLDDVATLRHHAGQQVEFTFAEPVEREPFEGLPGVEDVEVEGTELRCLLRGEPDALLKAAAQRRVVRWTAQDRELEDLFLDFYRVPVNHEEVDDDGQ